MRTIICLTAVLALGSSGMAAAKARPFDIKHTSWSFVDHGKRVHETIDADGNYIANAVSGKHLDHGTATMKDGKACFTSAMTKEGEECWTAPRNELKVGRSFVTHNDKGRKLKVTRIAYMTLEMPK
jgi:hypothetical protein